MFKSQISCTVIIYILLQFGSLNGFLNGPNLVGRWHREMLTSNWLILQKEKKIKNKKKIQQRKSNQFDSSVPSPYTFIKTFPNCQHFNGVYKEIFTYWKYCPCCISPSSAKILVLYFLCSYYNFAFTNIFLILVDFISSPDYH